MSKKRSILDVFTQITNEYEAAKPELCLRLINHLNSSTQENTDKIENANSVPSEFTYILQRLLQGLGGSRSLIRKCYFATLVTILSNCNFSPGLISLSYFKSIVDKQLSKYESKGEEGEVLIGRILAYGVALRSSVFLNSDAKLQQEILTEMITKSKERSYLPLLSYTFITEFLNSIDENMFKVVIWPVIIHEILNDWPSQTFETLYCLLQVQNKYPSVLKKKLIASTFKTNSILHLETLENVTQMMINITWESRLKHPLYDTVGNYLVNYTENTELLSTFWKSVENTLNATPSHLQQLAVLTIFRSIVKNLALERIPEFLTSGFIDHVVNLCGPTVNKSDKLSVSGKATLQLIASKATNKSESCPASVYRILCKLMFDSGHILIDKLTGIKIVFPCVSKLDAKHVKLLAKKCEKVIYLQKQKSKNKSDWANRRWNFKERCYASQLLARLISHPESQNMDWKIKHLKLLVKYAIFSPSADDNVQISAELSTVLKNSFFTTLSHQLSHLENHRMVLISIVYYIDNNLTNESYKLRVPFTDELMSYWKETMTKIQRIDLKINNSEKKKTVVHIFHTLFLQMALHIFVDLTAAKDIIKELDSCYAKKQTQRKNKGSMNNSAVSTDSEPKWIEIAVELFLSLLSRDMFLLRQLISRIFPPLCPYLTAQATYQILQVLDQSSDNNTLTDDQQSEEESNDEEEDENSKEIVSDGEDESDSEVDDSGDDVEESAVEKTRQAVRDALGVAGSVTDTESLDLDDIDEEEGRKLDVALSDAFRIARKPSNTKNKKQSTNEKALMNFRIRVLDLVNVYLENEPSVALVLDTIPILFSLLEFCIKDHHQKPLEIRLRSTLKKLSNLKKCSNMKDLKDKLIADVLKTLMEKGVRTTPVFLDLCSEISECCTFLFRIGVQISNIENESNETHLSDVFARAIDDFFLKRDCLLPIYLFENILLKIVWPQSVHLCERILKYAFDCSVRGFRRNQGLSMLCCFYKNTRLLSLLKETNEADFAELEIEILENAIQVLLTLKSEGLQKLRQSFISKLFVLLYTIKSSKFSVENKKWNELSNTVQSFVCNGSSVLNASRKYITKLSTVLPISVNRQSNSRKRKRKEEPKESEKLSKEECIANYISKSHLVNDESDHEMIEESLLNSKNVTKKKKSKRKSKEYFDSKRLRNELANDVDVLKFSKADVSKTI